jgi:hypothetical protein
MKQRGLAGEPQRTPRRASAVQPWQAPVRNHDWVAALIGHG